MGEVPLLANGFRPFFLGAALWLAAASWLWAAAPFVSALDGFADPRWHARELLFGGIGGILAGFLLTAVPNWTRRLPVRGLPLLALFLPWALARLLAPFPAAAPLAVLAEIGFYSALAGLLWREIIAGRNWRNLPVLVLVSLFAITAPLSHPAWSASPVLGEAALRLGLAAILMLLALIGGRITPSFTRNWLAKRGERALPAPFNTLDRTALVAWAAALAGWLVLPGTASGVMLLGAGALHLLRLARWRGHRTLREPLVLVLHLGYLWLGVGALLLGAALSGLGWDATTALHALSMGAIGTMTLAVMTRAALGHSGRPLRADGWTVVIYALVTIATAGRLAVPWWGEGGRLAAALLWGGAYLLFALRYLPVLASPRLPAGAQG